MPAAAKKAKKPGRTNLKILKGSVLKLGQYADWQADDRKALRDAIFHTRAAQNLTQGEVAEMANVSVTTVVKLENMETHHVNQTKNSPMFSTVVKICHALGLTLELHK